MNDKEKFEKMTKPLKFRRLRMFIQSTKFALHLGKQKAKYSFNYCLYKMGYLMRYTHRDVVKTIEPLPFNKKFRVIESENIQAIVEMKLIKETLYDIDYFYRPKKDGSKKVTHYMSNRELHSLQGESYLKDINIKVGDNYYNVDKLPIVKATTVPKSIKHPEDSSKLFYTEVVFDIKPVKALRHCMLIGHDMEVEDVSRKMFDYYYDFSCMELKKRLDTITLGNLMKF